MKKFTRKQYNDYIDRVAHVNGEDAASLRRGESFAVEPSVDQKLEKKIQDTSSFLQSINIVPQEQLKGDKVGLGVSGPVASRTDVTGSGERQTKAIHTLDETGYELIETDFDTHVTYKTLDTWAKFPNFAQLMQRNRVERIALDRIMIGWNGEDDTAADTDLSTYPLLQDMNKGWIQELRDKAPTTVMSEGATAGEVRVGTIAGRDYYNLDQLVFDMVNSMIKPWFREDPSLRVILGRELLSDKYFPIIGQHAGTPTEAQALDMMLSNLRVGNLPAVTVPYFPARGIMVTRLDNLSLYYQEGARRLTIVDNAKKKQVETYQSSNEDYVIEEFDAACFVENIKLPNMAGDAWS